MQRSFYLVGAGFWVLMFVFTGFGARAAQPAAPAPEPSPVPQSVFVDDANVGKDPFFPRSTRRGAQLKTVALVEAVPDLLLKGVSGTAARRLAIINNRTFEVGEESELKSNGQSVRVKCVEIKDKSVTVQINGVSRELFLSPR